MSTIIVAIVAIILGIILVLVAAACVAAKRADAKHYDEEGEPLVHRARRGGL